MKRTPTRDRILEILRRSRKSWFATQTLAQRLDVRTRCVTLAMEDIAKNPPADGTLETRDGLDTLQGVKGIEWRLV